MKKRWMGAALLALLVTLSAGASATCPTEDAHRYGPWKTKTSATCTRQGHQFRYCQKCDHWEQRHTAKLPHTLETTTVLLEPTCTEPGREEGVCTVCGNLVRRSIDKLPHPYGEMVVTREPTCTKVGRGEFTCTVCGHVQGEKIAELGHDWGAWTVTKAPEGKKKGTRVSVCQRCAEEKSERFYPDGTLYEDMTPCEAVITLQERLRDLGYYNGSIRSGAFGGLTTRAVETFQRENGLEATGLADEQTQKAIAEAWTQKTGKQE